MFKEQLVSAGTQIQHNWFRSRDRIEEKLAFTFPNKTRIIDLMLAIEAQRDKFCYGTDQPITAIRSVLDAFHDLRDIFATMGVP